MERIKLVVAKGHTLGYILPQLPNYLQILHGSILRGAPTRYPHGGGSIMLPKDHRLATAQDFKDFRVSHVGFTDNPKEYEFAA